MQKTKPKIKKATPNSAMKDAKENKLKSGALAVYDMQGNKSGEVPCAFGGSVNTAVLSQAVAMYLANKRCGLAATKTRGEVSGGGKKPWKQKGTGRARAGSSRSPLWRHGGVVFGPHPRNFHYALPPKIRNAALLSALNEKILKDDIMVLEAIKISQPKSKEIQTLLNNLKVKESATIVMQQIEKDIQKAVRNFPHVRTALAKNLNALEVLETKKILISKDALKVLQERLV